MRRNRGNGGFIWFIFLILMFSGGLSAIFPLLLIIGVVMAITMGAVRTSNSQESARTDSYRRTNEYYRAGSSQKYSAAQMAKINVYLRSWFRTRRSLPIGSNIDLRIHGERYASLASLDVYRNNTYICSLSDFGRRYPDSYNEILRELSSLAEQGRAADAEVIDVEATDRQERQEKQETKKEEPKKEEKKTKGSQDFINEINQLNDDIPDENISNGLYETCALLKQIQTLEERFPASRDKLKKLYEYYLPILIRILKQ